MVEVKIDTVNKEQLYKHFIDCRTNIGNIDLLEHTIKLRQNACTIEAWNEEELCGLCACYMNNYDTKVAYITHIEVHPEYKHQGLGSKIMDATIAEAKSKGFNRIQLEVHKDNGVALLFYERFGFCNVEDRGEKYLMSKDV